jgi:hypothetical protein
MGKAGVVSEIFGSGNCVGIGVRGPLNAWLGTAATDVHRQADWLVPSAAP